MTRPGRAARALAARWCSAATMERLIDPVLADLQVEYAEARARGQLMRSYWIWLAGHFALGKVIALHGSAGGVDMIAGMSLDERGSAVRAVAWSLGTIIAVTAALSFLPFRDELTRNRENALTLFLWLVPQALPVAIPVGLVVAILQAWRHGTLTAASRTLILGFAMVLSVGSLAMMGWVIPETNQAYRERIFRRLQAQGGETQYFRYQTLARGPGELTLGELRRAIAEGRFEFQTRYGSRRMQVPSLEWVYYLRWALAGAPLVFALFAIVVATRLTRGRILRWLVACAVVFGYWAVSWVLDYGLDVDRTLPMLSAWAPNVAILMVTAALAKLARPRAPILA